MIHTWDNDREYCTCGNQGCYRYLYADGRYPNERPVGGWRLWKQYAIQRDAFDYVFRDAASDSNPKAPPGAEELTSWPDELQPGDRVVVRWGCKEMVIKEST